MQQDGHSTTASVTAGHVILVFGAAVNHDGTVRRSLALRLRRALAEAARAPEAVVIVSGGRIRGRPAEAPIMRDWLGARGVDVARIVVEATATSTRENAHRCADLIATGGFSRVTLVTERFHVLRARLFLARALASRGVRAELCISAAPDHLGLLQRIAKGAAELVKLAGDLRQRRP